MPRVPVGSGGRVPSVLTSSTAAGPGRPGSGSRRSSEEVRVGPVRSSGPPGPRPCPRPLASEPEAGIHTATAASLVPLASCTSAAEAPGPSPGHGKAQGRSGPPPPGRAAGAPWPARRGRIPRCGARAAARAMLRSPALGSAGWRCARLAA